ncbi:MAG TPA: tRNA epoxyqueuosine(34) reductase QueG, partial [Sorangium sp.]|nr:tRNA epoxyqueuosine(34) reductase QueG [Sorangium sp.]
QRAQVLGFDKVGFARADQPLEKDHQRYQQFIDAGMHGDMAYLANHRQVRRRVDTEAIVAGARTVVCLAEKYRRAGECDDPPLAQLMARYARGRDYHNHLRKRVRKLAQFVTELQPGAQARALCDTAPVLERAWAARAGLGFIGKNGLLIVPGEGSYCLLAEVVTTVGLPAGDYGRAMGERCGSCTACLDVCPTQAFVAPFVLDPRRCLSFLTIETKTMPPAAAAAQYGEHLFGCDDCQQVCPYNAVRPRDGDSTARYAPLDRWREVDLHQLVTWSEERFDEYTRGTPLRRARRRGLARNAVMVAAARYRRGDERARAVLAAASAHDDAAVAALARQALAGGAGDEGA